jgi:tetratricopeptide (TPR) repeat protein
MKAHQYEAAREKLFQLLKSLSDQADVARLLFLIGESYYRQTILNEAEYYFNQVLQKATEGAIREAALYRLGWIRMRSNRWEEASEIFSRVKKDVFSLNSDDLENLSVKGKNLPYKNPTSAGVLAGMLPGLGHAYVSRYKDATVAFLLNGLFIWAAIEAFDQELDVLGGILTFLEIGWYTGNIYSAVNVTHKYNRKIHKDFLDGLKDRLDLQLFVAENGYPGLTLTFRF